MRSLRDGFTLYEVLMAALVLAMGVLGPLALFPKALDVQQRARQRVLAGVVAVDLVTRHATGTDHAARIGKSEYALLKSGNKPDLMNLGLRDAGGFLTGGIENFTGSDGKTIDMWERTTDAEAMATNQSSLRDRSFYPLPPEILARLDSDYDEIRHLNETGVGVYYLRPMAVHAAEATGTALYMADEAQSLIFAVVGYPQMNANFHSPSQFHHHHMIDSYQFFWRHKARFLERRLDEDGNRLPDTPGAPRWRSGFFDVWRYRLKNAHENPGIAETDNNGAFVFPFKYYFWDFEAQVLDPYVEWDRAAHSNYDYDQAVDPQYRIRDWEHATTAVFDHREDTDTAFPLRNAETNSLFAPFQPLHRCRQLVFWAVDWKSYEDSELQPEEFGIGGQTHDISYIHSGHDNGYHLAPQQPDPDYMDGLTDKAGDPISLKYGKKQPFTENWRHLTFRAEEGIQRTDDDDGSKFMDRNFNETHDIGPVPRSVRMRARTIARFNYYDKRLQTTY